jgi:hypothetical protein
MTAPVVSASNRRGAASDLRYYSTSSTVGSATAIVAHYPQAGRDITYSVNQAVMILVMKADSERRHPSQPRSQHN